MKIITTSLAVAGFVTLAACGSGAETEDNMAVDNLMVNDVIMDANMTTDLNAMDGMNATENAMVNDLTNNDADTNLANGM